jgi:hypothetical protein
MMEEFNRAFRLAGTRIVESTANFLPGALVFVVLLIAAFAIAALLRWLVYRSLQGIDFDRRIGSIGLPLADWTPSRSATALVASIAFWTVLALGLLLGLTALDAALPSQFAVSVLEYVPHVVAASAILLAGGLFAGFLSRAALIGAVNQGFQHARLFSLAVKWLVLIVAGAMALDHIRIGRTILLLAFAILFGGIVLATALAVGLGAKDAVRRAIERQAAEPARSDPIDHV